MAEREWRDIMWGCERRLSCRNVRSAAGSRTGMTSSARPSGRAERLLDQAQAHRVWLANRLQPSVVPDVSRLEVNIGAPALQISPAEAAEPFAAVLAA